MRISIEISFSFQIEYFISTIWKKEKFFRLYTRNDEENLNHEK